MAVLVSLVLQLGGTYSWFTQSEDMANVLMTKDMRFSFTVVEVFEPPETVEPGQSIEKVVNVKNTGDIPGFVRVLILAEIVSADGMVLEAIPGITYTFDGLNTTDWSPGNPKLWADGADGYYYYLAVLEAGQTTDMPLFIGITLADNLGEEYQNAGMKIEVKLEATETVRAKYRDGWWKNGDVPPAAPALIPIDDTLKLIAKEA